MNRSQDAITEYREQITRCTQALALANNESVERFVLGNAPAELLKLFTDGNLDKRFLKLQDHFEQMATEFEKFDDLLERYIRTIPLAAYDTGSSDSQRFLDWLCGTRRLTDVQRDHVACQRSRYAIELAAESNRLSHVRFQELWAAHERLGAELESNENLWIHLNPIHSWGVLRTPILLDEETELPATVLFYPVGADIHTAVVEPDAEVLVRSLESRGTLHLDDLASVPLELSRGELIEFCLDLAGVGLVAFG
jgi:hypothetical protein